MSVAVLPTAIAVLRSIALVVLKLRALARLFRHHPLMIGVPIAVIVIGLRIAIWRGRLARQSTLSSIVWLALPSTAAG
jgi:hypothetical protein